MATGPRLGPGTLISAVFTGVYVVLNGIGACFDATQVAVGGLEAHEWYFLATLSLAIGAVVFGRAVYREVHSLREQWETLKRTTPGLVPELAPPPEANMTARQATYYLRDEAKWPDEKGWSRRGVSSVVMASGQLGLHASLGHVRSWGRAPAAHSQWEVIDPVYWKAAELDAEDLGDENGSSGLTQRDHQGMGSFRKLVEIRFNRGDISDAFPR